MKLATGVDLVEIERIARTIERFGSRFLQRVYTSRELQEASSRPASLAARFAAKEAVSKALGTGIGSIGWREIEVLHGYQRQPVLHLHGAAATRAAELGLEVWSISLSHSNDQAIAMAVALSKH